MKLKIKPSARIKKRYLLIEANSTDAVKKAILDYIGVLGWAKAAPVFVPAQKNIILSIERNSLINVRAALAVSNENIKVLRVSGTLNGLGGI